jgi:aspartate aminotransferase
MTGWRIGYAGGPADLIKAMKKVQSQSTSNPTSISQVAAQAALEGDQGFIEMMNIAFRERHEFIVNSLNEIKGVECLPSDGAFYAFPKMDAVINALPGIDDDIAFGEYLINEAGVALVPGSAFGSPGYMRLSFATSMEKLQSGMKRIRSALST